MKTLRVLIAVGIGVALADASIVTLALPELLIDLDTGVEGVAAVIGIYTLALALALPVAALARRALPDPALGALGFAVFAIAGGFCAASDTLTSMLVFRTLQALGAAAALVAGFALLGGGGRLWVAAAVFGTAVGPALGGALTQAFDWRAIFAFQVPVALAAAAATALARGAGRAAPAAAAAPAAPVSGGALWADATAAEADIATAEERRAPTAPTARSSSAAPAPGSRSRRSRPRSPACSSCSCCCSSRAGRSTRSPPRSRSRCCRSRRSPASGSPARRQRGRAPAARSSAAASSPSPCCPTRRSPGSSCRRSSRAPGWAWRCPPWPASCCPSARRARPRTCSPSATPASPSRC